MFFKAFLPHHRIYLDHASSTPLDMRMLKSFPKIPATILAANPSALHKEGVALKSYLDTARSVAAKAINAHADEIVFTSGATESDNLALVGTVKSFIENAIAPEQIMIFASDIEHAAVTETAQHLGVRYGAIPAVDGVVDPRSIIMPEEIKVLIISVMYVNNETGTVQPIKEIAKRVRQLRKQYPEVTILFHVDATQAPLYYLLNVAQLGIDMMTLGATKLYCPKGVGLLYKKRNVTLSSIMYGGGQERGLRPGTEPVQLIHDFVYALAYAQENIEKEYERIAQLQSYFEEKVKNEIQECVITAAHAERAPHITHLAFQNFDSELLVIELDARGIAVSAKSACKNEEDNESPIVENIYGKNVGAVRCSFGRMTTKGELDRAVKALRKVLHKYKK